jgi:hypothetical protein
MSFCSITLSLYAPASFWSQFHHYLVTLLLPGKNERQRSYNEDYAV